MSSLMIVNVVLFFLYAALQAGDGWTTAKLLARPGGKELNLLMRHLMATLGVEAAMVVIKGAMILAGLAVTLLAPTGFAMAILVAADAASAFIVWWNWRQL